MRKQSKITFKSVLLTLSLLITLVLTGLTTGHATIIKNGDACSPVGATFKQSGVNFRCTKSGSTSVWKSQKKSTASPVVETFFTMPKVVGMNLQLAQDLLQSFGSYGLLQDDFKGLNRFQVLDTNWKVCKQSPSPGKKVSTSIIVTLSSVKLIERC